MRRTKEPGRRNEGARPAEKGLQKQRIYHKVIAAPEMHVNNQQTNKDIKFINEATMTSRFQITLNSHWNLIQLLTCLHSVYANI